MKTALKKRLADYARFAAGVLLMANKAEAEVIYTDLEPDIALDTDGNYYAIDIDNNGSPDFQFLLSTFTVNPSFTYYYTFRLLAAGPFTQNAFAGDVDVSFYTGSTLFFPYALSNNVKIDDNLLWQSATMQFLAWKTWTTMYDNHCANCNWNSKSLYEIFDHFIGIRFIDTENKNHYGWIRCDVKEDGGILVIKDYAYETEPDYLIIAGSKETHEVLGSGSIKGEVYVSDNIIYISVTTRPEIAFQINIFNVNGQNVYASQSENPFVQIPLEVPKGIYFIEILSGDASFRKQVLID